MYLQTPGAESMAFTSTLFCLYRITTAWCIREATKWTPLPPSETGLHRNMPFESSPRVLVDLGSLESQHALQGHQDESSSHKTTEVSINWYNRQGRWSNHTKIQACFSLFMCICLSCLCCGESILKARLFCNYTITVSLECRPVADVFDHEIHFIPIRTFCLEKYYSFGLTSHICQQACAVAITRDWPPFSGICPRSQCSSCSSTCSSALWMSSALPSS